MQWKPVNTDKPKNLSRYRANQLGVLYTLSMAMKDLNLELHCMGKKSSYGQGLDLNSKLSGYNSGCKESHFTACHLGKLKLTFTSPNIISASPKNVLTSRLISQFFCNLNSSKKFTYPSGKIITEFTSPIANSTSPGLSDTTFFARCNSSTLTSQPLCLP